MHDPLLHRLLARARIEDLRRAGAKERRAAVAARPPARVRLDETLTLRYGYPDDELALRRLAALDSARPPALPVLVAELGGELRAAVSLADGSVVADPFHPTAGLVDLLRARAAQLTAADLVSAPRAGVLRRLRPRLGRA